MATVMDLATRNEAPQQAQNYAIGMTTLQGFELAQRAGKALSQSTLVPKEYQNNLPNCIVALNMAQRLNADPLMVMQNLVIVHGRPTWSAQFMISTANACGHFSALRYEWRGDEGKDDWACRAWAIEKETGERLNGTWVSIALSKKEGWYQKSGSKWQTMPQQMLMYRAGSWWVRAYAPELSMGLASAEEAADFIDVTPENPRSLSAIIQAAPVAESKAETVNQQTGEITTTAPEVTQAVPGDPPAVSVATLIKRLNACKDADAAGIVMIDPDVDLLNADDAGKLMTAYRAKFGGVE